MRLARGFTAEEDEIIRTHSRRAAAELIRVSYTSVKYRWRALHAPEEWGRAKAAKKARDRKLYIPTSRDDRTAGGRAVPSQEALAERERRLSLSHETMGAAHLGDPLPGYSALDRRR
jgi:hypothetical protein